MQAFSVGFLGRSDKENVDFMKEHNPRVSTLTHVWLVNDTWSLSSIYVHDSKCLNFPVYIHIYAHVQQRISKWDRVISALSHGWTIKHWPNRFQPEFMHSDLFITSVFKTNRQVVAALLKTCWEEVPFRVHRSLHHVKKTHLLYISISLLNVLTNGWVSHCTPTINCFHQKRKKIKLLVL